ncbi:hypothetical protein EB118_12345 [bacterium]|nr:hypothetical protein [bacterium]
MLILDLNQIMISSIVTQLGNHTNTPLEEDLVRHIVLNTIRSLKTKFSEYGELVIACDDKNYWRRSIFPYYKGNRKKDREKSDIDWSSLFNNLNKIKQELKDNFPYRVVQVLGAEADDVIATLCENYGEILNTPLGEKIMILSGDKDFIQLHKYSNVSQYDPVHKKQINDKDPIKYLEELILKGDRGDGIPNVLSPDNCLVDGLRQKPLTAKKIKEFLEDGVSKDIYMNYIRNKNLIDFSSIPEELQTAIMEEYASQSYKGRDKLFNYFVQHKLKNLMEHISEF